ncbi:peptide-binding protein [Brevibacillus reuszeri]|uniref:ABC transporter substrate-binding protein n=1 Tax=Brevibacillus reuszeri TaxID=54915 RepID=A0A0K9YKQ6_9BACL|nr:SgrR family transcriptional regulator [Brevibacillus reuszeri]KNB68775.1 ABC transporter substrate-binding protein [Brevibacillus reuszeri]MED1859076.1 ABC transporter substrate-binding protein [Brevibacillus reuszeri]GED69295.1 peptide-binding protein [Brevibacillus reuszeri]
MASVLHFLELRSFFNTLEIGHPFSVTIDKLTGIWHCTPRYAKLIVRKLCEEGWIEWQAGRGRGNTSMLTFLIASTDVLLAEVKLRMEQGDVKEAMELMNRFGSPTSKDQFMDWLSEGMGFSTQDKANTVHDTLRFPVYRKIVTLDPALVYYHFDAHLAGQLFNTLVTYDHETKTIHPCIAHSWETSPDQCEWTFHLRKNVLFHHGRELTAQDVIFSLDRLRLHPERFEASWMVQDIAQLEAINPKTVRIRLKEPNHLFLRLLTTVPTSIVPEDIVRQGEPSFAQKPVGTGPFQLARFKEDLCVLEAFPAHFLGRPQLDRVEVLTFPELESGRIKEPDWTSVIVSHGVTTRAEALREAVVNGSAEWCNLETFFSCCNILVFNQWKNGPHSHPKFRLALDHLIDREQMIADLGGDRIYPATGFRPFNPATEKSRRKTVPLQHAEIMTLIADSGYRGEVLRLVATAYHEPDALWIKERCLRFGINLEVEVRDQAEFATRDGLPEHDCQLFGNVFSNDEISELEMYIQKNYFLPAFDEPLAKEISKVTTSIFREPSEVARRSLLAHAETRILNHRAVLYLVQKKSQTSFHKSVRGVTINSSGWLDFHKIWFHPHKSDGTSP